MGAVEVLGVPATPVVIPTLQNWGLILLALLMPGIALAGRRKLEKNYELKGL